MAPATDQGVLRPSLIIAELMRACQSKAILTDGNLV